MHPFLFAGAVTVTAMALAATPAVAARPRVAVSVILVESNSLYPRKVPMTADETTRDRKKWLETTGKEASEAGGVLAAAASLGMDIYPVHSAVAEYLGSVERTSFELHVNKLVEEIKTAQPPYQGVVLVLHGSMVADGYPQGDAEVIRRVRVAMGKNFPIVVTHDFHANVAPAAVEYSDALITYKENPHLDLKDRGIQAGTIIHGMITGKLHPVQAIVKPPMVFNIVYQDTFHGPLKPLVDEGKEMERTNPKILAVSTPAGYQYADVPQMGPSVVVVTDGDLPLARREAQRLADKMWGMRERLVLKAPDAATAVRQANQAEKFPVVLMDTGDNIGGGSAGDGTAILDQLIKQKVLGWVVTISDRQSNEAAFHAGIGGAFDAMVGGKTDKLHGVPVRVRGKVKALTDGKYIETELRHCSERYFDMGPTAVIEVEGSTKDFSNVLLLTKAPTSPNSLQQIMSNGVYPPRQRILVAKGTTAPRAAYEPIAAKIVEVNTPGATDVNPTHFTYRNVHRPMFGLDDLKR